ncbi:MAG: site-2 protease family protein [Chloroflexi bacterium]|nr:MAG: site-2 protease family protein [Chloroflexota bacterium]
MLLSNPLQFIINAIYLVPALVLGLVVHEVAHAAVAVARGDQTPRLDGRLSLDPRHHLDPLGTLVVFFIYFGWGRPLRLNPFRMRSSLDPALVWLAGPLASLLVAIALSIPLKLLLASGVIAFDSPLFQLILVAFYFNVLLAVVNILPIPGLDGYNVLGALFRRRYARFFSQVDANRQAILLAVVLVVLFAPLVLGSASIFDLLYDPIARVLLGGSLRPSGF